MPGIKAGILTFPGSNCDRDMQRVLTEFFKIETHILWHATSIENRYDVLILPGGFSYGDYLRAGAIARFGPAMESLMDHAKKGGAVLGICNGFQILCEANLLPGALIKNIHLKHIARDVELSSFPTSFTQDLDHSRSYSIPVSHGEGNYRIDEDGLKRLRENQQIAFRYQDNPNGSVDDIAGIVNEAGNVFGMMPHPERATDPINGKTDGEPILGSVLKAVRAM